METLPAWRILIEIRGGRHFVASDPSHSASQAILENKSTSPKALGILGNQPQCLRSPFLSSTSLALGKSRQPSIGFIHSFRRVTCDSPLTLISSAVAGVSEVRPEPKGRFT